MLRAHKNQIEAVSTNGGRLTESYPLPYHPKCEPWTLTLGPATVQSQTQTWLSTAAHVGTSPQPQVAVLATHKRLVLLTLQSLVLSFFIMLLQFTQKVSHRHLFANMPCSVFRGCHPGPYQPCDQSASGATTICMYVVVRSE